jgi:hypothetical protein
LRCCLSAAPSACTSMAEQQQTWAGQRPPQAGPGQALWLT